MDNANSRSSRFSRIIPFVVTTLVIAGVVMLVFGIARGEARTVEMKAVRICLECIGIG